MSVVERHLRPRVLEALDDTRVVVVLGARQVGKSTLVQDVAARDRPATILTLDDQATRDAATADPTGSSRDSSPRSSSMRSSGCLTCCWRSRRESTATRDGREVDVVLERRDGSVVAVEVKTAASASPADFRGLRHLRDKLGERFKTGVLLYTGEHTVPFEDRLAAVPLSGLWADSS